MRVIGDLVLINGKIDNLAAGMVSEDPPFNAADEGVIIYNLTDRAYKYNNGSTWVTFQVSIETSNVLLTTLGDEWINPDFTFNPNPFNALQTISGLTSGSSLFNVFKQMDANLINALNVTTIRGIPLPTADLLSENDVIFFNGVSFEYGQIGQLGVPNVAINQLNNVTITSPIDNDVIVKQGSEWVNKRVWFQYENLAANTTFVVNHGLGNRFCHVTVVNAASGQKILDSNISAITYNTDDQITVELTSAMPVNILVTSFAPAPA